MGPGPDGVEIRSRNLFMEGTEKNMEKGRRSGRKEYGRPGEREDQS